VFQVLLNSFSAHWSAPVEGDAFLDRGLAEPAVLTVPREDSDGVIVAERADHRLAEAQSGDERHDRREVFLQSRRFDRPAPGPVLNRGIPTARQQSIPLRHEQQRRRHAFVVVRTAFVFGIEVAPGVGRQQAVVGAGGKEAEFLGLEEDRGDPAVVQLRTLARFELGLVLTVEHGDGAVVAADGEPLTRFIRSDAASDTGEFEGLQQTAVAARHQGKLRTGDDGEAIPGYGGERGHVVGERVAEWLDLLARQRVEPAIGAGDVDVLRVRGERDCPAGKRHFGEGVVLDMQPVKAASAALRRGP